MKKLNYLLCVGALALMTACGGSAKQEENGDADSTIVITETQDVAAETDTTAVEAGADGVKVWDQDTEIKPDASMPVIIDFSATWCGPCQRFKPTFHKVAAAYAGKARFVTVDIDDCPAAAKQFGVQSIPQVSVLKSDGTIDSHVGLMTEDEFESLVKGAL